jgi:hypothetical protein
MIKRNSFVSKYANVPTDNISSWSASSKETILACGADIEQSKISDVLSRNSKTNSVRKRRTEFTAKVNLKKLLTIVTIIIIAVAK